SWNKNKRQQRSSEKPRTKRTPREPREPRTERTPREPRTPRAERTPKVKRSSSTKDVTVDEIPKKPGFYEAVFGKAKTTAKRVRDTAVKTANKTMGRGKKK
ncbi:MAG: hypothetical protein RSB73_07400, partial [Bacteroidales bacterium]